MHDELQGIVCPNINILSSFIPLMCCLSFFLLLNTRKHILKNVSNQTFSGLHFNSIFLHTMEVNGYRQLYRLQNILFCVQQKTEAQVGVG